MRKENKLNVPNVHSHTIEARRRTNGHPERLQSLLDNPEVVKPQNLWQRFLAKVSPSNWEQVTVNKQVDSITLPKWAAVSVLGAVLTFGVQSWWARSADHDTLVRIEAELRLAKEAAKEKNAAFDGALRDLNSWKDVMNGNQKQVIGMLSAAQANALEREKKPQAQ